MTDVNKIIADIVDCRVSCDRLDNITCALPQLLAVRSKHRVIAWQLACNSIADKVANRCEMTRLLWLRLKTEKEHEIAKKGAECVVQAGWREVVGGEDLGGEISGEIEEKMVGLLEEIFSRNV